MRIVEDPEERRRKAISRAVPVLWNEGPLLVLAGPGSEKLGYLPCALPGCYRRANRSQCRH